MAGVNNLGLLETVHTIFTKLLTVDRVRTVSWERRGQSPRDPRTSRSVVERCAAAQLSPAPRNIARARPLRLKIDDLRKALLCSAV